MFKKNSRYYVRTSKDDVRALFIKIEQNAIKIIFISEHKNC